MTQRLVWHGEIYIDKAHTDVLKDEAEYVKRRYRAVARTLANKPFKTSRKEAAKLIGRSLRQLYRILRRFLNEGVSGLTKVTDEKVNLNGFIPPLLTMFWFEMVR